MTPQYNLNLGSQRSRKARLRRRFKTAAPILQFAWITLVLGGLYCLLLGDLERMGYVCLSLAAMTSMLSLWYRYDLQTLPPNQPMRALDDLIDPDLLAKLTNDMSPRDLWTIVSRQPEGRFICAHLLIDAEAIGGSISELPAESAAYWQFAQTVTTTRGIPAIHAGALTAAIIIGSQAVQPILTALKIDRSDVMQVLDWLDRQMRYATQPRPNFGGIGRDWATGFTPTLDHFGENISMGVQAMGGFTQYLAHADLLSGLSGSLSQGSAVALVGEDGVGKSTLMLGLAERLLEGRDPGLQYYQIVSLNASVILSNSNNQLEQLMLTLFGEAVAAGNIILFLDDAHLFFGSGVGAFDMSQVLLPILGNRRIRVVAAFTPTEWQQLQAQHSTLASRLATIIVPEPPEASIMPVLQDEAIQLTRRSKTMITHEAVREAYRLSGQFMQERSYPGKAISLLEQALPYADQGVLTAESMQRAIEKIKGVRVTQANADETDMLMHLEDRIHERMINQTKAVNVVAAALRRGRAGVTNPKRPLGSFLFLGPTGVGKTELARSLAAVYYGDEAQMIRLDMSEYQRPEDVVRLLATGGTNTQSLLLAIRQQPFSVVLLDEIEKAHPNILNLMLQMLDEGQLTDEQGRPASFRSSIIIATSNAGAADITQQVQQGASLENFERPLINSLITAGQFKPELINRFDEIVLFRPLNESELAQVAQVMLRGVNKTLEPQRISVTLTDEALKIIVHAGYDPEFGARPMRRVIQKTVENAVANKILTGQAAPGSVITLDVADVSQHE
jgi:ATP-dependent Clp protease ATP-binding subunit ClpC